MDRTGAPLQHRRFLTDIRYEGSRPKRSPANHGTFRLQPMTECWDLDRVLDLLRDHAISLLLALLAGLCVVLSLVRSSPQSDDLVEVTGAVQRTEIYRNCRGRVFCDHALLVTLDGQQGRFRIEPSLQVLQIPHPHVRTYAEREPSGAPTDGDAVRTWGLWVNRRAVRTVEESIAEDGFTANRVLPLLAMVLAAMAVSRFFLR